MPLDGQERDALRSEAELEGRSDQEVVRQAVCEYTEPMKRRSDIDAVLDDELPRYDEALRRLGRETAGG